MFRAVWVLKGRLWEIVQREGERGKVWRNTKREDREGEGRTRGE